MSRPQNIGIKAIELYFPNQCVEQSELEKFDGVSGGKYTIGLGQKRMSFCDDREDIYSLALTTVSSLLKKYSIDPTSIGRMEVGTETILDKSKSVKTVLMQLFQESGNANIEGVDTVNACYGGTSALFNAVNWMESSSWDGRDAIVVAGDIALYKKGNARPTGGVGCVAMLIGPDAPITFEPGMRGTYIAHTYDFYKPDLTSEYPVLDGQYSLRCYTEALDKCYQFYQKRQARSQSSGVNGYHNETNGVNGTHHETNGVNGAAADGHNTEAQVPDLFLDNFDHMTFHAPTGKVVLKSYARLLYNDYLANPNHPLFQDVPDSLRTMDYQASLTDKTVEKTFVELSKKRFEQRVKPSTVIPTLCGNMYTASVYSGLCSLLSNVPSSELMGRRLAIFSFGSGLASSLFSLKFRGDVSEMSQKLDAENRLAARKVVPPQTYDDMCNLREKAHLKKDYVPSGDVDNIAPGTYYLTGVDHMFRRSYEIKS